METIVKEVDKFLRDEFPGAVTEDLELVDGVLYGYLLWKKFEGVSGAARTRRILDALRRHFGKKYNAKISMILPMTPLEMSVMKEELAHPL